MTNQQFLRRNVVTNVLMALSINTASTILGGGSSLQEWIRGCMCAFTINTVASVIVPVDRIGKWFAQNVCHTRPGRFAEMFSRNVIVNIIYVTIISFCMAMINVGIDANTVRVWAATYIHLYVVGLITSLVIEKIFQLSDS